MYGSPNQKPHVLKNDRPSNTFQGFVETVLRAVGASVGMPYEVVAKDFSKTNYSSARAALLEAWRVYQLYRVWMERHLCQPVWRMVLEEAWLRGELALPKGGPDFYEGLAEYTHATWIGPPRGHVDPVKEMTANIEGLNNNILTLSDLAAEQGKDWETQVEQRGRETRRVTGEGLAEHASDPGNSDNSDADAGQEQIAEYQIIKEKLEAFGVGVRAGGITPHQEDEKTFRKIMNLPEMSQYVQKAWDEDEGFRRPITLSSGQIDAKKENPDDPTEE
jgi:hypothetical protein